MNEPLHRLAKFGAWAVEEHRENECSDIDGGDIQEKALECGVLIYEKRDKPCGEDGVCWCASYFAPDEWPVDCLRLAPGVREAINELLQTEPETKP